MAGNENAIQFSATVLIQNIDPFSNGDSRKLKNYFRAVEHAAALGNWNEEQKFAIGIMRLKDEALECCNTSVGVDNWPLLQNALTTRFGAAEPRALLRRKLNCCTQRVGEDPIQFSQRLKTLAAEIHPNLQGASEEVRTAVADNLTDQFISGLRASLRKSVMSKRPETWVEAIQIAQFEFQLEEMDSSSKTARLGVMQTNSFSQRDETRGCSRARVHPGRNSWKYQEYSPEYQYNVDPANAVDEEWVHPNCVSDWEMEENLPVIASYYESPGEMYHPDQARYDAWMGPELPMIYEENPGDKEEYYYEFCDDFSH